MNETMKEAQKKLHFIGAMCFQWNRVKICIRNHFYAMEMIRRTQRPPPHILTIPLLPRYHRRRAFFGVRRRVRDVYKIYGEWEIDCGGILLILLIPSRVRLKLKAFIERFTIATHSNILCLLLCLFISSDLIAHTCDCRCCFLCCCGDFHRFSWVLLQICWRRRLRIMKILRIHK